MLRAICVLFTLICYTDIEAQVTKVVAAEAGINGFLGTEAADQIGTVLQIGAGALIGKPNHAQLVAMVMVGNNRYKSRLAQNTQLLVDQRVLELSAKVTVPMTKGTSIHLGGWSSFAFNGLTAERYSSFVSFVNRPSETARVNYSNQLQCGISTGTRFGFGNRKRSFVDLSLKQNLSVLFSDDVVWKYSQGDNVTVFNASSKPTSLIIGIGVLLN